MIRIASLGLLIFVLLLAPTKLPVAAAEEPIDFNRDIRPILSDNCLQCHGPDENQRQAGLRLDDQSSAFKPAESGETAIVPGRPEQSALITRIFSEDADIHMPPADSNKTLEPAEKELLRRWIAAGAAMNRHWAFLAPERPPVPHVKQTAWVRNPIDAFALARIESQGWQPAPQATRETLIRRLSFDLTGLPPAVAEIEAFLADDGPQAYEQLVDRLLASPHFGERMAIDWLDAARFADTNGYHLDNGRDMSAWRAWVIDAFNQNLGFDQFTIEQLAGDLLPNPTLEQQIASGFHRNHMINFEGGAIPEEYHTAYIVDRVNTTGTVWLGLTVGCGQCHDHKFDPLTQREFYQLYAFFNNVPENGLDGNQGNAMPFITVPTDDESQKLAALQREIEELSARRTNDWPQVDQEQQAWEAQIRSQTPATEETPTPTITLGDWQTVGPIVHPEGPNRGLKLNLGPEGRPVDLTAGYFLNDSTYRWHSEPDWIDGNLTSLPGQQAVTYAYRTIHVAQPTKVRLSIGSRDAVKIWLNRKLLAESSTIRDAAPDQHLLDVELPAGDNELLIKQVSFRDAGAFFFACRSDQPLQLSNSLKQLVQIPADQRTTNQVRMLQGYFRHCVSQNPQLTELAGRIAELRQQHAELKGTVRTSMVMSEKPELRETHMLLRGQYNRKGDVVTANVPAFLPPLPTGAPSNRLGLAQWLTDPTHPLVSRVIVNRFWQMLFGVGLVKTTEDFGSQGALPSHPQLLDWLATEFVHSEDPAIGRWNVKALIKTIVMSATYRQSSRVERSAYLRDPENQWLARGPRFRLQAEFIRDQALATSGLLQHRVGGPSVNPYQPAGLWSELSSRGDSAKWTAQVFSQSHGADLYRRSMYTFWKRTSPPPTLVTFDAPDRETCTVQRSRTNTPLQALILMNDPTYVEASRIFSERLLKALPTDKERLRSLFRQLTARLPNEAELAALQRLLDAQRQNYSKNAGAAQQLLSVGEAPRDESLDVNELAAWTMTCSAVMNLDEVLTKN